MAIVLWLAEKARQMCGDVKRPHLFIAPAAVPRGVKDCIELFDGMLVRERLDEVGEALQAEVVQVEMPPLRGEDNGLDFAVRQNGVKLSSHVGPVVVS